MMALRDKRLVAQAFSRAAPSYDSVAALQRSVADTLLSWLPLAPPQRLIDLGSGTGYATPQLRQRYAEAGLISLDLAEGMLQYARVHREARADLSICADAEALPFAAGSVDLIFSSLAIQWCERPQRLFAEVARVLRPGGRFIVATLGPATLDELRQAWAAVDDDIHVNSFVPLASLRACTAGAPLTAARELCEIRQLEYDRLNELMHELKALGAHNVNPRRQQGLGGPARLRTLAKAYERFRLPNGRLPASYELYFLEWIRDQ